MIGLKAVLKEAWLIIENAEDSKEKLAALSLAKDCYALQEELICNLPIIDEALKLGSEGQEIEGKGLRIEGAGEGEDGERTKEPEKEKDASQAMAAEGQETGGEGEGAQEESVGEKERYDIQRPEEKIREDQNRETTNKTF
jgi:hypothetical protein